jgi:DNA-binding transcriptional LysR family regulator
MSNARVSVDDLRVFLAVAQAEHVTAAAGRLHLSQPTITRSLGRLEHQLGVQLFDRPGHRVRLNEFGRVLVRFAERIVGQLDAAEGELARLSDPHAGPVRVGFLPSLGTWLVPDLIRSFRALEPGVQFVLRQATAENLADMLHQGEVDLAITSPKPRLDEPTDWNVLINERLGLAVPPDHRLADRRRVNLSEVAAEPFVAFSPEAGLRQISDRLCRQAGFSPAIAFESGEVATIRAMVGAGLGVAILPIHQAPSPQTSPPILAIAGRGASRPLGLAWLAHRRLPGITEAFRTWLTHIQMPGP